MSMGPDGAVIADQRREADTKSSSLRENERGMHIPAVWNPHWRKPTDPCRTYSDDDLRLGLNAAQTTLAAIAELAEATLVTAR